MKVYGMLFAVVIGTLLHFTYGWSGKNPFIAVIAPIDQSIFQQLKLLFTPYMLWMLVEYEHYGQYEKNFIPIKAVSLFAGMIIIVLLLKLLPKSEGWIDIAALLISVPAAFVIDHLLTVNNLRVLPAANLSASLLLFLTALAISAFTFYPPEHSLFTDRNRPLR